VDDHFDDLVQRVQMVMAIADELKARGMLQPEPYSKIRAEKTNQEKMRELYEVLNSGGDKVKSAFYSCLEKHEPLLLRDLGKSFWLLYHMCLDLDYVLRYVLLKYVLLQLLLKLQKLLQNP